MSKFLSENPELVQWLWYAGFAILGYLLRVKGISLPLLPATPAPGPAPVLPVVVPAAPSPAVTPLPGNSSSAEALLLANGHPIAAMLLRTMQSWLPKALQGAAPIVAESAKPQA